VLVVVVTSDSLFSSGVAANIMVHHLLFLFLLLVGVGARRHRQPPMGSFVPDGQTNGINFIPFVCPSHSTTPHRSTLRFHVSSSSLGPRAPGDVHVVHVLIEPMVIIMSSLIDRLNIAISSIQLIGGDFSSSSSAAEDATSSRRRQT
jgi:hypothetical protein